MDSQIKVILDNMQYTWMVIGIILIMLEVSTAPGLGILCGGLAAISVGVMVLWGFIMPENYTVQLGWFFAWTVIWAIALWKPLLKLRNSKNNYHNMIGERAIVHEHDLIKGKTGQVKWSGTIMKARILNNSSASMMQVGQEVIIVEVKGNILLIDTIS